MVNLFVIWIGFWIVYGFCYIIAVFFAHIKKWWLGGVVGIFFAQLILSPLMIEVFFKEASTSLDYRIRTMFLYDIVLSAILGLSFLVMSIVVVKAEIDREKRGFEESLLTISKLYLDIFRTLIYSKMFIIISFPIIILIEAIKLFKKKT